LIEQLFVQHLRGLDEVTFQLAPHVNVWVGENGAGKTSVLEAVSLLSTGRSFVTSRTKSLIKFDAPDLTVFARVLQCGVQNRLAVQCVQNGERRLRVNGAAAKAQSALSRLLPALFIAPQMPDLVTGAPGDRRRFLDWGAFHCAGGRAAVFGELRRALLQRNTGLRSGTLSDGELDAWDRQIAWLGEQVHEWREAFFAQLATVFAEKLCAFDRELGIELDYQKGWAAVELGQALVGSRSRDRKYRLTQVGPQRAELVIRRGGDRAADVLSRGQCKTVHMALVLSQLDVAQRAGMSPVLCLDDPGAELDDNHQTVIWGSLQRAGCQVLATGIDLARVGLPACAMDAARVFHVKRGQITLKKEA
jgi:DNA replication and repair protein RecF